MPTNKENINNLIEDDLAARNQNWDMVDTHLAETVIYTIVVTRDISPGLDATPQVIDISPAGFLTPPKKITAYLGGIDSNAVCVGFNVGTVQRVIFGSDRQVSSGAFFRFINATSLWEKQAAVSNITTTSFQINWQTMSGTPSGTAQILIIVETH